jgi:hypothetical protein
LIDILVEAIENAVECAISTDPAVERRRTDRESDAKLLHTVGSRMSYFAWRGIASLTAGLLSPSVGMAGIATGIIGCFVRYGWLSKK